LTKEKECVTFLKKGRDADMIKKMMERLKQLFQQNNYMWKCFVGLLMVMGAIGIGVTCVQAYRRNRAEAELERLAEYTDVVRNSLSAVPVSGSIGVEMLPVENVSTETAGDSIQVLVNMEIPIPEKEIDFSDLQTNVNKDIYAWINIPDTKIDYPVLQGCR